MRMNIDDSRLIVRFQRLITETLVEKRLGQRRPELTDELYQTWQEVGERGLKETPEYRDVLLRADRHASWLAGLVRLAAPPVSSPEREWTATLGAPQKAASPNQARMGETRNRTARCRLSEPYHCFVRLGLWFFILQPLAFLVSEPIWDRGFPTILDVLTHWRICKPTIPCSLIEAQSVAF